ncbi:sugar O-acyltransferase, sialic acid O-acetyltransferase NeuD family [Daejeonella rubra]|uniref:Sugar O-acyltransferase, sialic acid O-acetyltransferase NeuD family n=1 Tax=Daejeonella rubra TaxID=990371 RepID=A0A1G9WTR0_9SPHI|nr:acetyltransferase [Daejeonella rubra]SDM87777.1 sugar O-acyltransferase, sialic acid O-acetyltransferase NeuD family [Daejeonella rubra]
MIGNNVIIGYSGHSYVILEILLNSGVMVDFYCDRVKKQNNPYNLNFLGNEENSDVLQKILHSKVYLGIGNNNQREKVCLHLLNHKIYVASAIHNSSIVASTVIINEGTVIMPGAVVQAMTLLGKGVICNTAAVIEHECKIGDFCHIAPGAVLAGNVSLGERAFVGANSVIKEGVSVGNDVIIGAGSVVIRDIPDNSVVAGNPSKSIR